MNNSSKMPILLVEQEDMKNALDAKFKEEGVDIILISSLDELDKVEDSSLAKNRVLLLGAIDKMVPSITHIVKDFVDKLDQNQLLYLQEKEKGYQPHQHRRYPMVKKLGRR